MSFSNTYTVTTALVAAFAAFVIYVRLKNWLQSNIPIFFYVIAITYMRSIEGSVPFWLLATGFGFTLLLRFEFMSERFIGLVKLLEFVALGAIIYLTIRMILGP